jgi:superfamily I DNA and/or RNA helicase
MKPTISHFPNSQFYEGKVKDGPNVMSPAYGNSLPNSTPFGAYAFLDCRHGAEVAQQKGWKNPKEVEVVTTLVTALGKGTYSKRPLEH